MSLTAALVSAFGVVALIILCAVGLGMGLGEILNRRR